MAKKRDSHLSEEGFNFLGRQNATDSAQAIVGQVAKRFDKQYKGEGFALPPEVEAMPIFLEWTAGTLANRINSNFWEIAKPQKHWRCLDIGCGVSFLIYPWREWDAYFYGQEISIVARDALNSRGSQLNSKLFKGVELGSADQLQYAASQFDLAIATGWSQYYELDYWNLILAEVKRVLKPGGQFVFDILNPEKPLVEDWAILETYLGTEVFLEPISAWEETLKAANAKIVSRQSGELFEMYKVQFSD
ncbi:class I SAM-dependent methyltransferase [Chlorogloea sp. CCALA 695]|uniref:class I SAM-dependent methyltransferase n=1 Tax=Chlorogloea sp. CCALA 695 TaxID=2107693 RepID=UPI000D072494|nr:class I SAM-dependent methyltransferase [Chlorogloea sp. CCALA 695]PSB35286.1 SAM-dependent methyltransferase [Chlorogloea sp. CCALA 695]